MEEYREWSEKTIMVELKDVNEVSQLGLQLGLSAGVVDRLERDHRLVEDRKQAMVIHWLKNDASASWNKLSNALKDIEHEVVAKRVRQYTSDPAFKVPSHPTSEDMYDGDEQLSYSKLIKSTLHTILSSIHRDRNGFRSEEPTVRQRPQPHATKIPPDLTEEQFPSEDAIKWTTVDELQIEEILKSVHFLLMVVNKNEYRAVLGLMKPIESVGKIIKFTEDGVTFMIGKYGEYRTAVVQTSPGGHGFDGAVQKTIRAVDVLKPSVVISVGVAYGKSKETQRLGDVLVCNLVHDYAHKRLGKKETCIRNPQFPVGGRLLDIFKNCLGWRKERGNGEICSVKFGPLVSDSNLIDNLQEKEKILKAFPDAIGGEMEGASIMSAIQDRSYKLEGIVIKAICDWGDGSKNKQWQPFAAHAAADYVLHQMKKETFGDLLTALDGNTYTK